MLIDKISKSEIAISMVQAEHLKYEWYSTVAPWLYVELWNQRSKEGKPFPHALKMREVAFQQSRASREALKVSGTAAYDLMRSTQEAIKWWHATPVASMIPKLRRVLYDWIAIASKYDKACLEDTAALVSVSTELVTTE